MDDERTYDYVYSFRAVTSVDGMTADYFPFTNEFLSEISSKIINEVKGINRVTYNKIPKLIGTIERE
jgi:GMP synthase (glutamine-hydrolysing)